MEQEDRDKRVWEEQEDRDKRVWEGLVTPVDKIVGSRVAPGKTEYRAHEADIKVGTLTLLRIMET